MIKPIQILKIVVLFLTFILSVGCESTKEKNHQNQELNKENLSLEIKKLNKKLGKNTYEINRLSGIVDYQKLTIKKLISFIKENEESFREIGLIKIFNVEVDNKVNVKLFYFNENRAKKLGDPCSSESISYIEKSIPLTDNLIENTIRLRLLYRLSEEEIDNGFNGDFPITFQLTKIEFTASDSVITLDFFDLENFSCGGSCRAGILQSQIRKTALQFPQVKTVIFPNTLFQP